MLRSFASPLDEVSSVARDQLGAHRYEDGKYYKYVKIANVTATVAGAKGDPVAYAAATGYDNNTVVLDITDADAKPHGAGILQGTVTGTLGVAYYGWVQIKGKATLVEAIAASVDGTPVAAADGDPLVFGAADKVLRRANTVIDADAERRSECAIAIDASAKTIICNFPF